MLSIHALPQIVKTDVCSWSGKTDSLIVYKEYSIDTIIGNDTVFFVQYWHKEWLYDSVGTLIDQCLEKDGTYGLEYNGRRNGYWYISSSLGDNRCFSESAFNERVITSTICPYFNGDELNSFFFCPKNKYFFLQDTLEFCIKEGDKNYLDMFSPDSISVTVTQDTFTVKINECVLIKENTKFINEVSNDLVQGSYYRKYLITLDSIKNVEMH